MISDARFGARILACETLGCRMNPKPLDDLTGRTFGRWSVIERVPEKLPVRWLCHCECGRERGVDPQTLKAGRSQSCGCLRGALLRQAQTTHGEAGRSPEYTSWLGMKDRCYRKTNKAFPGYGGRGITVCARWLNSFPNFLADMGRKPSPSHSIDRIENDKGYEPGNCRWATRKEQSNNQRVRKDSRSLRGKKIARVCGVKLP